MASDIGTFNLHDYSGFCNQNSLSKELVLKRERDELELDVIKDIMTAYTYNKKKKHLSNEEVGRVMVGLLGTKKIDDSVLEELRKILNDRPAWVNFVNSMLGFDSVGTFAKELSMFWTLYKALQHSDSADWKHNGVITPTCAMYLIDRLALQASLWSQGDYLYATKSAVVEWILHENIEKYSNIPPNRSNLSQGLQLINSFLYKFLDSYTNLSHGQKSRVRWIHETKGHSNVHETETNLVVWLTAAKCLLHINCGFKHSGDIHWLLENEGIKKKLPLNLLDTLSKGFGEKNIKELELVAISDALKLLENPLVIVELKRTYKKTNTAPRSAILLNFETWQDRSNVLKELFPSEVDEQIMRDKRKGAEKASLNNKMKGSEAGFSSEVEQMKRDKMKGPEKASSKKTDFSWLDIVTKFDLDNGKSEGEKLDLMRY